MNESDNKVIKGKRSAVSLTAIQAENLGDVQQVSNGERDSWFY